MQRKRFKQLHGVDGDGKPITIKPGQRFTLEKRKHIAYELQKDASHRRVTKKPTGRARRLARQMEKRESAAPPAE